MRTSTTGRTSRSGRGFTLVELCVVALLIVTLAAVAAPSFAGFWRASQGRNCAWQLAALFHRARDYAVAHAVRTAVEYRQDERQFRLMAETVDADATGELQDLSLAGALPVRVPEDVEDVAVSVEGRPAAADWQIIFFPDGQALAAQIVLAGSRGAWSLEVDSLTGRARVVEGDVRQPQ